MSRDRRTARASEPRPDIVLASRSIDLEALVAGVVQRRSPIDPSQCSSEQSWPGPNRRRSRNNARHRLADMQAETKQQEVPAPITFAVRNKCVQRVRVVLVSNLSRLDPTEREWLPLVWPDLESRGVGTDPSPPDPVGLDKWLYESGTRPEDYAASDRFMDTYVQAALARASTSSPSRGQLAKDGSIRLVSGVSSARPVDDFQGREHRRRGAPVR